MIKSFPNPGIENGILVDLEKMFKEQLFTYASCGIDKKCLRKIKKADVLEGIGTLKCLNEAGILIKTYTLYAYTNQTQKRHLQ